MATHFYLDSNKRTTPGSDTTLIVCILRGDRQIRALTQIRVKPRHWSKRRERLKPSAPGATVLNAALDTLKAEVDALTLTYPVDADLKAALLRRLGKTTEDPVSVFACTI